MHYYLDFEKPVAELEMKIEELKRLADGRDMNITDEIRKLEKKAKHLRMEIFSRLTPWQKTLIARHPERPHSIDYIRLLTQDFIELHGDRRFSDDPSIICGLARFNGIPVVIVGHEKGRSTKERIWRNFGQPHPEGYRKAIRVMELAGRLRKPVITLIDTAGAYPGIGAEERGQAEAIAVNIMKSFNIRVPLISIIIGEGGSGGALAMGVADRILMLEHSIYSVISPEGCAAILWKRDDTNVGQEEYEKASEVLKITAQDLYEMGIIDEIIPEPLGGAHTDYNAAAEAVEKALMKHISSLMETPLDTLLEERYKKFRSIGAFRQSLEVGYP